MSEKNWYALYTKPRHEFKAEADCLCQQVECYLPLTTVMKQWSDRKKKVTEPLLRGYIFVFADEKERYNVLQSKAIVNTVCFSGIPAKIPVFQIENLKCLLKEKPEAHLSKKILKGAKVIITSGSFLDVEGVVYQDSEEKQCLAVSIDLLNRSVIVHLPATSVVTKK